MTKSRGFLRRWGARIAAALAGIAALLLGRHVVARRAEVDRPTEWHPVDGRNAVRVRRPGGAWSDVDLPPDVVKDDVRSVGFSAETDKEVRVETLHDTTDRRDAPRRDDSAAAHLGR